MSSCIKYFGKVLICLPLLKSTVLCWPVDGLTLPGTAGELTLIALALPRVL